MQTRRTTQARMGRIFALFLYIAGAGMLFPACNGSTGHTGTAPGGTIAGGTTVSPGGTTVSPGGTTTSPGGVTTAGGVITSGGVTSTGGITQAGGAAGGNTAVTGGGHYQMENLDRGVVAVKVSGGVYVGWRMFGTEYDTTASNVSYNLYRDGTKVQNVTDSTNFLDAAGTSSSKYSVSAVIKTVEGAQSTPVTVWAQQYLSIPITPPSGSYSANDASTGDLDGDGKLDIVLKWDPSNSKDSGTTGTTDPCIIDGYTMAGKKLWSINVGMNIRAGAHDTQFSVYDFDGDGKAEVAFKTAPGTKDGKGNFLSKGPAAGADNTKDYRSTRGMVLEGPEWLTVFSGVDGSELATIEYPVPYGTLADAKTAWGDADGNRSHRYNGGFAWVKDGGVATGRPSIIQQRGYYERLTVSAMTYRDGVLAKNWVFDSTNTPGGSAAAKNGNHSCMAADVDNDGAQEIIPGSSTINSDGTFRCSTGIGHGDALHVGELVVGKGISVFMPHENAGGQDCHDASTCTLYFNMTGGGDNGRGVAEYVAATDLTAATCSSSRGKKNCGTGADVSSDAGSCFLIYWNAGELRSTMNGTGLPGVSTTGTSSCNGTKNTPTLTADLLGDWREEAVLRESGNTALRVYTTTNVTKRRIYTLMHDPTYRAQVSFEQSSYNQPPHVGFHIGQGMADPPKPDIYLR
jgi:rhamnogalacturonan endolyase